MNDPVDLTKCQPGDLLRLLDGRQAVYLERYSDVQYPVVIHIPGRPTECVTDDGFVYDCDTPTKRDVVAIVHPTRAELEEQRRKLIDVMQIMIRDWDSEEKCDDAFALARSAIARAEATHE